MSPYAPCQFGWYWVTNRSLMSFACPTRSADFRSGATLQESVAASRHETAIFFIGVPFRFGPGHLSMFRAEGQGLFRLARRRSQIRASGAEWRLRRHTLHGPEAC